MPANDLHEWRKDATVQETPEAEAGGNQRDESLKVLRDWMANRADVFVAVGGKWWSDVPGRAGVPLELELARKRGLPCFILGGFGGASSQFLEKHPNVFSELGNGLSEPDNVDFATTNDIARLAGEIVAQMSRLPLRAVRAGRIVQPLEPSLQIPKRFRILSLDGGGVRGEVHGSHVLAALEQDTGKSCVDHFDLIAGTSTGGIIAIGLGLGMTAADIVDFYRQYRPTIFPSTGLVTRLGWIRQLFRPKHSHLALRKAHPNSLRDLNLEIPNVA